VWRRSCRIWMRPRRIPTTPSSSTAPAAAAEIPTSWRRSSGSWASATSASIRVGGLSGAPRAGLRRARDEAGAGAEGHQRGAAARRAPHRRCGVSLWKRLCALIVGGVFVGAAVFKLQDPPGFAHQIHNYELLPDLLRNPLALVLPWMEGLTGLVLVVG